MPISFDKPLITHTKFKYRVYRVATNGFKYSQERYSNRVKKTYLQSKYHVTPEAKIRRKCQKMDESSDSDTERIVKTRKLASLGISRKSHSSLQSRLSNMLKYSEILSKPRNLKNGINVNKENRLECDNSENLEEGKDDQITSNSIDNSSDAMKNDDLSDDNLDILRELALKSKTQRVPKPDESDNHKNDDIIENSDLRSKDVDKELEELRLDALKSAMLKKAFKRKRIKNDKKDKKSNDLNDKQIDISQTALSPISLESNVGNLMYDYSNSNFEYYSYINPRVYYDLDKVAETGTVDSNNANKENTESRETHKPDDEDEESLRNRLLLMLKSKKEKQPDLPHEIPCPKVNIKHDDSSLIIKLGGSDTESECEETKNLALMHDKILNQNEFQRNLEYYLKEARQTALDKMSYDSSKFNNGISRDGEEAHMVVFFHIKNIKFNGYNVIFLSISGREKPIVEPSR